jgi:hypothetical protein
LPGGDKVHHLGSLLSRLGGHRQADGHQPEVSSSRREPDDGPLVPTKALKKFLSYLGARSTPVLLDLGPVVGSNVTYFGEQLGCKVYIEDIFADLDRHTSGQTLDKFPAFLGSRFTLEESSVDGVLLWDLFDYMDRSSAQALAAALVKLMRHDAALLGFFGSTTTPGSGFTRFVVVDDTHLRHRGYPSTATRQRPLPNRDIIKMFDGLRVTDSFLLQNNLREILFRKGAGGRPII